jgi:two-component system response regulator AtoC
VPLTDYLLKRHSIPGRSVSLTVDLRNALNTYHWPGNVRELENVVRKLIVLRAPDLIAQELRTKAARRPIQSMPAKASPVLEFEPAAAPTPEHTPILEQVTKAKQRAETEAILAALNSTRWNRKQAATLLKIDYKALLYKMKKLGVEDNVLAFTPPSGTEEHERALSAAGS